MYNSTVIISKVNIRGKKAHQNSTRKNLNTNVLKPFYKTCHKREVCEDVKYKDLQHLKQFLMKSKSQKFYDSLKSTKDIENSDDEFGINRKITVYLCHVKFTAR